MAPGGERQLLHILLCSVGSTESSPQVISDWVLAGRAHQLLWQKLIPMFLQMSQLQHSSLS